MYDVFIKAFRDEIISSRVNALQHRLLGEYEEFMDINTLKYAISDRPETQYFDEAIRLSFRDAGRLASMRLAKRLLGAELESKEEKVLFDTLERIVHFYTFMLSGAIVKDKSTGKVIIETMEDMEIENQHLQPGTILYMGLEEALSIIISGKANPILKPYFELVLEGNNRLR